MVGVLLLAAIGFGDDWQDGVCRAAEPDAAWGVVKAAPKPCPCGPDCPAGGGCKDCTCPECQREQMRQRSVARAQAAWKPTCPCPGCAGAYLANGSQPVTCDDATVQGAASKVAVRTRAADNGNVVVTIARLEPDGHWATWHVLVGPGGDPVFPSVVTSSPQAPSPAPPAAGLFSVSPAASACSGPACQGGMCGPAAAAMPGPAFYGPPPTYFGPPMGFGGFRGGFMRGGCSSGACGS